MLSSVLVMMILELRSYWSLNVHLYDNLDALLFLCSEELCCWAFVCYILQLINVNEYEYICTKYYLVHNLI